LKFVNKTSSSDATTKSNHTA